jgi:hypothetical protein
MYYDDLIVVATSDNSSAKIILICCVVGGGILFLLLGFLSVSYFIKQARIMSEKARDYREVAQKEPGAIGEV